MRRLSPPTPLSQAKEGSEGLLLMFQIAFLNLKRLGAPYNPFGMGSRLKVHPGTPSQTHFL
jgi:hypothetical protein